MDAYIVPAWFIDDLRRADGDEAARLIEMVQLDQIEFERINTSQPLNMERI